MPKYLIFAADAEAHPLTQALIAAVERERGMAIRSTRELLHRLTGKDNPGAVAAAYAIPDTSLARIDRSKAALWVVAENLKDPGNFGTMLRTCDATGAGGVILLDHSLRPLQPRSRARLDGRAVHPPGGAEPGRRPSSTGCAPAPAASSARRWRATPSITARTASPPRPSCSWATSNRACPRPMPRSAMRW